MITNICSLSVFPFQPHYDVGILLTIVLAIVTIVLIFALRYKCKSNRTWVSEWSKYVSGYTLIWVHKSVSKVTIAFLCLQDSVHQQTMRAISRLETKTYNSQGCSGSQRHRGAWGSASSSNSSPVCAICLEEFQDGQVRGERVKNLSVDLTVLIIYICL